MNTQYPGSVGQTLIAQHQGRHVYGQEAGAQEHRRQAESQQSKGQGQGRVQAGRGYPDASEHLASQPAYRQPGYQSDDQLESDLADERQPGERRVAYQLGGQRQSENHRHRVIEARLQFQCGSDPAL